MNQEQKIVDLTFELVLTAYKHQWFRENERTHEEVATWVADQLKQCGIPTHPCGLSWGVLDKDKLL